MSFYSELKLVVNTCDPAPREDDVKQLLVELEIIDPRRSEQFCNLADDVSDLFSDPDARLANNRLFCPDAVGFSSGIEISSPQHAPEATYAGSGWCVSIHGNGYFYPWTNYDLRKCVNRSTKLVRLRQELAARYPGRFVIPSMHAKMIRDRLIDATTGWVWIGSESF